MPPSSSFGSWALHHSLGRLREYVMCPHFDTPIIYSICFLLNWNPAIALKKTYILFSSRLLTVFLFGFSTSFYMKSLKRSRKFWGRSLEQWGIGSIWTTVLISSESFSSGLRKGLPSFKPLDLPASHSLMIGIAWSKWLVRLDASSFFFESLLGCHCLCWIDSFWWASSGTDLRIPLRITHSVRYEAYEGVRKYMQQWHAWCFDEASEHQCLWQLQLGEMEPVGSGLQRLIFWRFWGSNA